MKEEKKTLNVTQHSQKDEERDEEIEYFLGWVVNIRRKSIQ